LCFGCDQHPDPRSASALFGFLRREHQKGLDVFNAPIGLFLPFFPYKILCFEPVPQSHLTSMIDLLRGHFGKRRYELRDPF